MAVLCITFCALLSNTTAQTQSILLPIPSENASMINFSDQFNPVLTSLPSFPFTVGAGGPSGLPHVEPHLQDAFPPMFEQYLGQHPMFAQTVVHDADGNLLFFIVDNNIYNRYGVGFTDNLGNIIYLLNGNFANVPSPLLGTSADGYEIQNNRFLMQQLNICLPVLDPEICIFPLKGDCYKYGLVFSIFDCNAKTGKASEIVYITLTYVNDFTIELSDPIPLLNDNYINEYGDGCFMGSTRDIAVTEYREEYDNYLLFLNYYENVHVLEIDGNGDIELNNIVSFPSNLAPSGTPLS